MPKVEVTLSVKRRLRHEGHDLVAMLAGVSGVEVIGGEPHYAVDVRLPADEMPALRRKVAAVCEVEETVPMTYL